MAHLGSVSLLVQTTREVAAAKDNKETDDTLREFGKCAVSLQHVVSQWNFTSWITISKSYRWPLFGGSGSIVNYLQIRPAILP